VSGSRIQADTRWLRASPLTQYSLEQEVAEWQRVGLDLQLQLGA
jgi:exopolyphosphatase/guanosine-5'-triphosphate,3'-diphosphate pyrophosphatase